VSDAERLVWVLYVNSAEAAENSENWVQGVFDTDQAAMQHWGDTHAEEERREWEWRPYDGGFWATPDDNWIIESFYVQTLAYVFAKRDTRAGLAEMEGKP